MSGYEPAHIGALVSGLDPNIADANTLTVSIDGEFVKPYFVGQRRSDFQGAALPQSEGGSHPLLQVNFTIPPTSTSGKSAIFIQTDQGGASPIVDADFPVALPAAPRIVMITNAADGGLDVRPNSDKATVRVFLIGLPTNAEKRNINILLGETTINPMRVCFVPGNASYMIEFGLPSNVMPGVVPFGVRVDGVGIVDGHLTISSGESWLSSFMARLIDYMRNHVFPSLGRRSHG
jgi:hypothetical protein